MTQPVDLTPEAVDARAQAHLRNELRVATHRAETAEAARDKAIADARGILDAHDENAAMLATARGRIEALEAQVLRGPRVSQADVQSSLAISALVELHRVTTTGPGGRGGGNTRYLDAARRLGDELADAILDPSERPAQV